MKMFFGLLFIQVSSLTANPLVFTAITDPKLHQQFSALSSLEGVPYHPSEKAQMTQLIDSLLIYMAPRIKALPGYRSLFVVNCTAFFNVQLEQITCGVDFEPSEELQPIGDARTFVLAHVRQLQRSHILRTTVYVDWLSAKYQNAQNQLYFRQPWDWTMSQPASESVSESSTQTVLATFSGSLSASATKSELSSWTYSQIVTATPSNSASKSDSQTSTQTLLPSAHTVAASGVCPTCSFPSVLGAQNIQALTWELQRKGKATMTLSDARSYCQNKGSGWRLPSLWELYGLYQQISVLNGDWDSNAYWTSTPYGSNPGAAIYFPGGGVDVYHSAPSCVRCVR